MTQPRFFWRRILAFLVDVTLAYAVTLSLLLPFHDPDQNGLRLSSYPLQFNTCAQVQSLPKPFHDLVAPEQIASATLCRNWSTAFYNGRTVEMVYALKETRDGAVTTRSYRTLTVSVDKDGIIVTTWSPHGFMLLFAAMVASAKLTQMGRSSPGKRLVNLRMTGGGCAICREFRRFAPLLVLEILGVASSAVTLSAFAHVPLWGLFGAALAVALAFLAYYIWPMIRWRGAMPWDRATGFKVTRR